MKTIKCKHCDSEINISDIEPTTLITKVRCVDKEYKQLDVICPKCDSIITVNYEEFPELYKCNEDYMTDKLVGEEK